MTLLSEVEIKYDTESDISLAYNTIKDLLKKYKGSIIDEDESTRNIEVLIMYQEEISLSFLLCKIPI
jgi:hypothetical protein